MVSTLHRSVKQSVASASPDRHDMACVGKASGNDPRVGARALPDRWSRPSGDGDVICTCSGDDFCVCRAKPQRYSTGASGRSDAVQADLARGVDTAKGPCYQNAKQVLVGQQRRIDAYEFRSKISRVEGREISSFEQARSEKRRGGRQRRKRRNSV